MTTKNADKDMTERLMLQNICAGFNNIAGIGVMLLMLASCNTSHTNDHTRVSAAPLAVACSIPENSPPPVTPVARPRHSTCPVETDQFCPSCGTALDEKLIVGEIERVTIEPQGFRYQARIDTGASLTTLHATDLTYFERDGERWIRFQIDHPQADTRVTLEKPVVRKVVIKDVESSESLARNAADRRPVIRLNLALGPLHRQVEVTLTDRSHMKYPMLLGRNFLLDSAIVDVSRRNSGHHSLAAQGG